MRYNHLMSKTKSPATQPKITYRMLERISYIHRKIKSGCFPNTRGLAEELESGTATISRDLEYMRCRMNAPIEYDHFHKGFCYTENFEPDFQNHFSQKELQTLLSAKILLSRYKNTPVYQEAAEMIDLLTSASANGKNSELLKRIAVAPTEEVSVDGNLWNLIQDSLSKNLVIQFDYEDRWGRKTEKRKLCPYQLVLEDDVCYLFGFDKLRNAERIFSLSRIKNAVLTDESFELPDDFEFESRTGDSKFGAFFSGKKEHYVIDFFDETRKIVKERKWAENQKITENDWATRLEFDSTQSLKIKFWVLSNGANARPWKPDWLAQDWVRNVQEMFKMIDLK